MFRFAAHSSLTRSSQSHCTALQHVQCVRESETKINRITPATTEKLPAGDRALDKNHKPKLDIIPPCTVRFHQQSPADFRVVLQLVMGSDQADLEVGESSHRYAARMVYLTEEDEGTLFGSTALEPMGRTLKPPVLFMSRRQARADSALCAHRATKSTGVDPLRGVRAQAGEKKPLVTRRNDAAARGKRKSDNKRETAPECSADDKPANWRRVKEAGVAFWVNDVTGVATDECPHDSLRPPEDRKRAMQEGIIRENDAGGLGIGQEEGTGALVYDSSEFEQAMRMLDGGLPGPLNPVAP